MKNIILTITLLGLFNYCFGQVLPQQKKEQPLYLLNLEEEKQLLNWQETKESTVIQPNAIVLSDGMVINEKRHHHILIKKPDMSQVIPMPQVPIDTSTLYHIQIVGEVKKQRSKK